MTKIDLKMLLIKGVGMLLGIKFKISLIVFPLPSGYDKEQKIQKQKQNEDYQINTIIDYCIFKLSIWANIKMKIINYVTN